MKQQKIHITPRCPIRTTLELIGGKWKLLILRQLLDNEELRLSELKVLIPDISEKMLIQELKIMKVNHLVNRKNYGEVPPRVGYTITDTGRNVAPLIDEMVRFGLLYNEQVKKD